MLQYQLLKRRRDDDGTLFARLPYVGLMVDVVSGRISPASP